MINAVDVRTLRRQWKPAKERLNQSSPQHPTLIRFHRACNWLRRVEEMPDGQDLDLTLICQWIAFNSMYAQWDDQTRQPRPDRGSWRCFTDRVLSLDAGGGIEQVLITNKPLVLAHRVGRR